MTRIAILQGHPDAGGAHFCHALAAAYAQGAAQGGHETRIIDIARIDFPLLRSQATFESDPLPAALIDSQAAIRWAEHIVLVFPLWLGTMPALLKGFLEQVLRPGFAFDYGPRGMPRKHLTGRSARLVVTMGMPALLYRWYFLAHGLRGLERNILRFVGIAPVRQSLFGMVAAVTPAKRQAWLVEMAALGRRAR